MPQPAGLDAFGGAKASRPCPAFPSTQHVFCLLDIKTLAQQHCLTEDPCGNSSQLKHPCTLHSEALQQKYESSEHFQEFLGSSKFSVVNFEGLVHAVAVSEALPVQLEPE